MTVPGIAVWFSRVAPCARASGARRVHRARSTNTRHAARAARRGQRGQRRGGGASGAMRGGGVRLIEVRACACGLEPKRGGGLSPPIRAPHPCSRPCSPMLNVPKPGGPGRPCAERLPMVRPCSRCRPRPTGRPKRHGLADAVQKKKIESVPPDCRHCTCTLPRLRLSSSHDPPRWRV